MALSGLKLFYLGLGGLALIGGGAIFMARGSGGARTVAPLAPGADTVSAMPAYPLGSDSAPVQVDEYADFQCPACQRFAILTLPDVMDRLVKTGRIRWRFYDFPLEGHRNSLPAHEAAACVGEQGKFWAMHDLLYYNQRDWEAESGRSLVRKLRGYAEKAGADLGRYEECTQSQRYLARLKASLRLGLNRGVNSTPTFVIGTLMIPGSLPYDSLKALIDNASRAKKS